jgi:hypothetical protein
MQLATAKSGQRSDRGRNQPRSPAGTHRQLPVDGSSLRLPKRRANAWITSIYQHTGVDTVIQLRSDSEGQCDMLDELSELTAAQLSEHAARYAAWARTAEATRDAFDRLAKKCAAMVAERKAEEKQAA